MKGTRQEHGGVTAPGPLRRWLDGLLPPVCLVCSRALSRHESRVCSLCWARAPVQRPPRCPRCGIALPSAGGGGGATSCTECAAWLPYLRQARAPFVMAGVASALVHALKYRGWTDLAAEMGARMARQRFSHWIEEELRAVVPVPLSETRARERGYNQAELLAAAVASRRGLPLLTGVLIRTSHTRRQASLSQDERSANVRGVFTVPEGALEGIADTHVLLVDDVLTTGATAQECVRALCQAGARAVSLLTFGRARPELPRPPAQGGGVSAG